MNARGHVSAEGIGSWPKILSLFIFCLSLGADSVSVPMFEKDVRPILKVACFHCHGEDGEREGGLDVRLVRLLRDGGDSGSVIVPGDPEASLLWKRIETDEMPEGEKKLSGKEKEVIYRWLKAGAQTARPEPANVEDARFTQEELSHWAFQPVVKPEVPQPKGIELKTPVDGFIAQGLWEVGLNFSPAASRRQLVRRVFFDLTGLPPTATEVEAFVHDPAPDAYHRLVDRLLASPQFGVRWGRHWLDVAGYAESDGGVANDRQRDYAWRFRDYVVDAFNGSKPIDEFILEQLAGDELIDAPLDAYNSRQLELLTASGFLRMAPDPTQTSNTLADRNMAAADAIQLIGTAVLGLTVGCAQCHDHKYDPIGIDDYYRFRAIFDPVFPLKRWQQPNARLVDMTTDEVKAEAARIEAEAQRLEGDMNQRRNEVAKNIQELKLADVPEDVRDETRVAVLTEPSERTPRQRALLDLYPMVKPIGNIIGLLVEYDAPSYRKFEKEQQAIAAVRATKPALRKVMATREQPGVVPTSYVFFRGSPESPKEEVEPAELRVLSSSKQTVSLPVNEKKRPSTGRRLAYARHLTDGEHPLTSRVFVNRVWQHHLGRGLVGTPNDFGLDGDLPTHPELLDWLAADFVTHGWDQKRLHRQILLSRTYQQSSRREPELDRRDPDNLLFGRANLRRMEAEELRDTILFVSGDLNDRLGGASVPVTRSSEGKAVIGIQKIRDGIPRGVDDDHPDAFRRSLFIQHQRSLPLDVLSTFDLPTMNPNCDQRRPTTVATQSLWFLNDALMVERSKRLAESLIRIDASPEARIEELYLRLFGVTPNATEKRECLNFLVEQKVLNQTETDLGNRESLALATLCQTLMASNRFLYIE